MSLNYETVAFASMCRDIAPILFDHLWQSSLFACGAVLLAMSLRRYQAGIRHWLWLAGSIKFLLPFTLLASLGAHWSSSSQTKAGLNAALDVASQPFTEIAVREVSIGNSLTSSGNTVAWLTLLPALFAVVWFCGLVCVLGYWGWQWRQISKWMRRSTPLKKGREVEVLRKIEQAYRHRQVLEVRLSQDATEPGVVGLFHPIMLWPAGMSLRLNDLQLEAVLSHEVSHVRRRDNLTSAIQILVAALFWFHPLVWWLGTRLIEDRERACDEDVLTLNEPKVYAESILKVCEFSVESSPVCLLGIAGADLKGRISRIMSNTSRSKLGRTASAVLVAVGIASVGAPVTFGLIHGKLGIYGQILHANGPLPSYEVVTIKPFRPGQSLGFDGRPDVTTTVGPIKQLIGLAFNLPPFSMEQIVGAPEWSSSERYVVQGKIDESMYAQLRTMSHSQEMRQRQLLVQSLLADRMKLKVHFETRELPMYALVIDKGGSKLRPSKEIPGDTDDVLPPPMAPGTAPSLAGLRKGFFSFPKGTTSEMQAKGLTLDELAQSLQVQQDAGGRLIVNQTGLLGFYDCTMRWARQFPVTAAGDRTAAPESDEPPFFTAIREQLGLRLVPTKGPAEVIVIDHIERPSEKEN